MVSDLEAVLRSVPRFGLMVPGEDVAPEFWGNTEIEVVLVLDIILVHGVLR